ncbi:MAG: RNA polymerase sigma factor [Anaerolineae bacterium]|nr:RNA polymerase sigma factor [Gemmatimonadaceae bacterium]
MERSDLEAQLERHHEACYGWALTCCRWDRSEAEDVLNSSYLKVIDGRASYGSRSTFKTWLFGVIRRTAAEHRRRSLLHRLWSGGSLDNIPETADPAPDAASMLRSAESSERLVAALGMLPPRQREVLHLVFYQDLTIAEAAQVLGVSVGTARTHYERGKTRLRSTLKPEDDE